MAQSVRASHAVAPGCILGVPNFFPDLDVTEIYHLLWLEESGKRLDYGKLTHLVE